VFAVIALLILGVTSQNNMG